MDKYYENNGISNSSLAAISPDQHGSPKKFKNYLNGEREFKETLSLERGSLLHKWIEDPSLFEISEIRKPTGQVGIIIDKLYYWKASQEEISDETLDNKLVEIARLVGYGDGWHNPTIVRKVWETGKEYYDFLTRAEGKVIMTKETYDIVTNCYKSLNEHPLARKFLFEKDELANIQYFNELEVFWKVTIPIEGEEIILDLKGKLDLLELDFDNKIVKLKDLKTTSKSAYVFKDSFEHWRYYRQMAFYKLAVIEYCKQNGIDISGWQFDIYMIVVETIGSHQTVIWKVSEEWLQKGQEEYERLLNVIAWHQWKGVWDYTQEEQSNNLILEL